MKRTRNFTGDDLALAEKQMQDAYADYLERANSNGVLKNMAKDAYEMAVGRVKMIQDAIDAENNSAYKLQQEQYVAGSLAADTAGAVQPKDYTNYIYIGIAILAVLFFWKQSK